MGLKDLVGNVIMKDVIRATVEAHNKQSGRMEWRVLVVDTISMRMVSACTKMHDLSAEGITIVEMIENKREPMPVMEAIYFIAPTESSVRGLIGDFMTQNMMKYKAAHVFFTEVVPDDLFKLLCNSAASKTILSLVEVNISFIPCEKLVYSLDTPDAFQFFYNPLILMSAERRASLQKMADQVATLCSTLGEYPTIRYRWNVESCNLELAQFVQQKLDSLKADDPSMGEEPEKAKSQLIILDRGFDTTSLLLHELTYQAMVFELENIQNGVYKYEDDEGVLKEFILDENDDLWVEIRHRHIADVIQYVPKKLKKFIAEKKIQSSGKKSDLRDLSQMMKKMPQHKKQLAQFLTHIQLAEKCMKNYEGYIDKLCKVEQDLAIGTDSEGENIKDHMRNIVPILLDMNVTINDKIRIILLYIQSKNGVSEENLTKLIHHAQIPPEKTCIIKNMALLGVNVVADGCPSSSPCQWKRKERGAQHKYQMSRWSPKVKDIVEDAIEDELNTNYFPFLSGKMQGNNMRATTTSARYGKGQKDKNLPRIIVFIAGGCCYSEMRAAYEVTSQTGWEVIMGGSALLSPEQFLENVQQLRDSRD